MAAAAPAKIPGPTRDDKRRQKLMAKQWDAYRGDFADPLQKSPDDPVEQPDFNVKPNLCRGIVDTGRDFLIGNEPITLEVQNTKKVSGYTIVTPSGTGSKGQPSEAQLCLDDAWGDKDDMMTLFSKMSLTGGVTGHVVVKVIPPPPGKSAREGGYEYARMVLLDPETVSVQCDPDDYEKVNAFIIQYPVEVGEDGGTKQFKRQVIQAPDDAAGGVTWTISNYFGPTDEAMVQVGPTIPWPHPFAPIQTCPNLPNPFQYFGLTDLPPDIISINEAVILIASCLKKIAWYNGHPLNYTDVGFPGGSIGIDPSKILTLGTLGAKLDTVLARGDIAGLMSIVDMLRSDLDQMSGVPAVALGRLKDLKMGALSGVAEELMYARIIAKTTTKRRLYGWLIRKLCQIHLYFGGFDDNANSAKIAIHWPEMLPRDAFQEWQAAVFKDQLGVSGHTIFSDFGLDWDHEADQKQQEDQKKQVAFQQGSGTDPLAAQFAKQGLPPAMAAQAAKASANGAKPDNSQQQQGDDKQ